MKKIIATFDGLKYAKSTEQAALFLARKTGAHLVGVFLDDPTYTSYNIYEAIKTDGLSDPTLKKLEEQDQSTRARSAALFRQTMEEGGVEYTLHHDKNFASQEVKHESIYADLLLVSMKESMVHYREKPPTTFIRNLLADTQCPAWLVTDKFQPPEKIILLYDGEPSSVYAIKMFSYLLPQLKFLPTEVLTINPEKKSLHLPDNRLMKEFMKRHFPQAVYKVRKGFAEDEIVKFLKLQPPHTLVVMGAYRRSAVSRWFRESMADVLMKEIKLPLFIAHNKS